ncbi:unnamed protein product, partial [Vitis vinifera]
MKTKRVERIPPHEGPKVDHSGSERNSISNSISNLITSFFNLGNSSHPIQTGLHVDLHSLNALTKLQIEAIPELARIGEWLPLELEYWETYNCASLEELPKGFKRLKSLKELRIGHCPNLVSFPETGLPPTLRVLLLISDCPELRSFLPDEGLPATLSRLEIKKCPILRKRCLKEKGEDWARIAHIPRIEIFY